MCDDDDPSESHAYAYDTAVGHARDIVAAATRSIHDGGYWRGRRVPLEAEAMTAAIAARMRVGAKMGQTDVPLSVIRRAVEDVLGA